MLLSPPLSPLVPRGEREKTSGGCIKSAPCPGRPGSLSCARHESEKTFAHALSSQRPREDGRILQGRPRPGGSPAAQIAARLGTSVSQSAGERGANRTL